MQTKKKQTFLVWVILVALFIVVFLSYPEKPARVDFGQFLVYLHKDEVDSVRIDHNAIVFTCGSQRFQTYGMLNEEQRQMLYAKDIPISWGKQKSLNQVLVIGLPLLLIVALLIFFLRKFQGQSKSFMTLTKSRARIAPDNWTATFDQIGGCIQAKEQLGDVIDFLKHPSWSRSGARLPRGVLLEGPPGCGKTLLARAVAGETNAKFFMVAGSEFVEMFVGVGAARVRDMFEIAFKEAPSVVFVDELDAVGRRRGSGVGSAHDEREQTLNQLLVCMDGLDRDDRLVVLAATNRADILDKALLRPGRFDRRIRMPELDCEARLQVLRIHAENKALEQGLDLTAWADRTNGLNGAQLENLLNEAMLLAIRRAHHSDADQKPLLCEADLVQTFEAIRNRSLFFNALDALLIDSATQLAEPMGNVRVRVDLENGETVQGSVLWANDAYIKVREQEELRELILSKKNILKMTALEGTDVVTRDSLTPDPWSDKLPDMA